MISIFNTLIIGVHELLELTPVKILTVFLSN